MLKIYVLQIFVAFLVACQGASQSPVQSVIIAEVPETAKAARPSTYRRCLTPNKSFGYCLHLLRCPLLEFKVDPLRFADYLCIIDRVYIGVCCPDSFVSQMTSGSYIGNAAGYLPMVGNEVSEIHIVEIDPDTLSQGGSPTVSQGSGPVQPGPQGQLNEFGTPLQDSTKKVVFQERRGCGVNQNENYSRVIGGRPVDPKQWPWAVSLRLTGQHFCGGVLITDRHVLTAAHCLKGKNLRMIVVRLGEHDERRIDESRTQDFTIAEAMVHEDFDMSTFENDIAIIKMNRPAKFNSYAWPVCLPHPKADFADEEAVVIGWGATEYGGTASSVLMEVSVPVWNNTECEDRFVQTIFDTHLCAGGNVGKDSCQGDSGGPLLHQLPNKRWITIGVVSWGIGCGEDRPAIYTRVNKYLDWILKNSVF